MDIKYLKNYVNFYLSHLLGGTKNHEGRTSDYYALHSAKIKSKKLASLLEKECQEKNGVLTYPEYLAIEQFSKYGFHGTHWSYGGTPTARFWPKALLTLCEKNDIHSVVEFGPGEGALGVFTAQEAQKKKYPFSWSGIEIDPVLQKDIRRMFGSRKVASSLSILATTLEEITIKDKSLFVFSYSLDSIPPYLFTNTTSQKTYPNALIGIEIQKGYVQEIIIPEKILAKKGLSLKGGIFTDSDGTSYDLREWQLIPYQRAYLTIPSFSVLKKAVSKLPKGSLVLIIDEFIQDIPFWNKDHIFIPRDVEMFDRDLRNTKNFYETAGKNILYYLSFLGTYTSLLEQLGCTKVQFGEEHQTIDAIMKNEKLSHQYSPFSHCYALLATVTEKKTSNQKLRVPYLKKMTN